LCQAGKIDEALDKCYSLEKQTRLASDAISTGRLLVCIVDILGELKQWQKLNEHLIIMSKKRNQLKQAVAKMVQAAMKFVNEITDEQIKLNLINTLRAVTEGKIYVEVERARLTKILAQIKESNGLIEEAADVLQEVKVETFGSMEKREKVEFILEQMRLCLAKKDYIRTQILSRKISSQFFKEEGTEDLKLKYYRQMIEVDIQQDEYLAISKHFWEIYSTKIVQEDPSEKRNALCNLVVYLVLAPYDNEQKDLMHRRMKLRDLEALPEYIQILKTFTTQELVNWNDFHCAHEKTLRKETLAFACSAGRERTQRAMKALQERVTEHNIRVISTYYTQIRLSRLAQLLYLSVEVRAPSFSTFLYI
uniref:PCI domain-containing protein n=1 Tax=Rodentolepis nana TaxID=102285 RepID=A0A0R3TIF8_RODNA